jgi:hypothetical protein
MTCTNEIHRNDITQTDVKHDNSPYLLDTNGTF